MQIRHFNTTAGALLTSIGCLIGAPGGAQANEIKVVATIKPIHSLVAQVMGETGSPVLLVQGSASPHSYSLKPSDAKALNGADVVFRVSGDIEPFTRKIVGSLPKTVKVSTLADAPGLTLHTVRSGETFETHEHKHEHDHAAGDDGHGSNEPGTSGRDGHVWLDPQNAIAMVGEIARVLTEAAPDKAAVFASNAAKAVSDIAATEQEIAATIAPLRGKPFVVFHDAYQYFERRFDIAAIGSITVSPEVQPSAKRISQIRAKIKDLKAACVFAEPQFKSKLVDTVIEGTGARAGILDPEGASVEPGANGYAELLRGLGRGLQDCLGPAG